MSRFPRTLGALLTGLFPWTGGAELVITNDTVIEETNLSQYAGQDVVISNTTVTVTLNGPWTVGRLALVDGALLTHGVPDNTNTWTLEIHADTIDIDAGSAIDVSERGYPGGGRDGNPHPYGLTLDGQPGAAFGESGGSAGSYGGYGAVYDSPVSNPPYGHPSQARYHGSGGSQSNYGPGGNGGGRILLQVSHTVAVYGAVLANGGDGHTHRAGGGSGGSIAIQATRIEGTGTIAANGGPVVLGGTSERAQLGGGGGRVALECETLGAELETLDTITAHGGRGVTRFGSAGTVWIRRPGNPHGNLYIDGGETNQTASAWTPLPHVGFGTVQALTADTLTVDGTVPVLPGGLADIAINPNLKQDSTFSILSNTEDTVTVDVSGGMTLLDVAAVGDPCATAYHFDNVFLRNGGYMVLGNPLRVSDTVSIEAHGVLTHYDATTSTVSRVEVHASAIDVGTNGTIDVSGRGYPGARTEGNAADFGITLGGQPGARYAGSGGNAGSFGGVGGAYDQPATNPPYGHPARARYLGSGGSKGGWTGTPGADGGGLVLLAASGRLVVDGKILANGEGDVTHRAGPGSGGSVYLEAGHLAGIGIIAANGGAAELGGGGGRVYIGCDTYDTGVNGFDDLRNITAHGGFGTGRTGSSGTVLVKHGAQQYGDLYVDGGVSNATTDAWSPLTQIGPGTIQSLSANKLYLEDEIEIPAQGLVGLDINPNLEQMKTFRIVSNTASTVTVDVADGILLTDVASVGDTYAAVYRFDNVIVRQGGGMRLSDCLRVEGILSIDEYGRLTHDDTTTSWATRLDLRVGRLEIGATGAIDVTGRGYLGGRREGNTSLSAQTLGFREGATYRSAGSYGGMGAMYDGRPNPTYGSAVKPVDLGSGGSAGGHTHPGGGDGGGRIAVFARDGIHLEGSITADGGLGGNYSAGDGSGGSIFIETASLAGAGRISASGGADDVGGGGGRVAISCWGAFTLPAPNVTAAGGVGSQRSGEDGSVDFLPEPILLWETEDELFHHTSWIVWSMIGISPDQAVADVSVTRGTQTTPLSSGLPASGSVGWDTTGTADGYYQVEIVVRDPATGARRAILVRDVLVNNAMHWHDGSIVEDQTWAAGTVHVVEHQVVVKSGVTLTIEPGAIVKFADGARCKVESGGTLDLPATSDQPIVLTSLADDSAGGDSNLDGQKTLPQAGGWDGIAAEGTVAQTDHVELRYARSIHSGTLAADERWAGSFLHEVIDDVVITNGVTLSIESGAVVKFGLLKSIVVQSNGVLVAQGEVLRPVVFTAQADDEAAGDTNRDGGDTQPAPGDWRRLYAQQGRITLEHTLVRYAGGTDTGAYEWGAGAIRIEEGSEVVVADSWIRDSAYEGIHCAGGGRVRITNSVIADTDRAVNADGAVVDLVNCTLYRNRIGLWPHGGTINAYNTLVSHSLEEGVHEAAEVLACNVWSPVGVNGDFEPGIDGNISADPWYRDAAGQDLRLTGRSPCVDAALGTWAPEADLRGAPRYDEPGAPNHGTPMADGTVPDIGAYEFVENADGGIDLAGVEVVGPSAALAGETVLMEWTLENLGTQDATGPWRDEISLVRTVGFSTQVIPAGVVRVGDGATVEPGETYRAAATVQVPGATPGTYAWQVFCNRLGDLLEGTNRQNNSAWSTAPVELGVPELPIGTSVRGNAFSGPGDKSWFVFTSVDAQDVLISLDLVGRTGRTELYVRRGEVPTPETYDFRSPEWNAADTSVLVPALDNQTYYILVLAPNVPAGSEYVVKTEEIDYRLTSLNPSRAGNAGSITLEVRGGDLDEEIALVLRGPGGEEHPAEAVFPVDASRVFATFDVTGASTGLYDVEVNLHGAVRTLAGALEVVAGGGPEMRYQTAAPALIRAGDLTDVVLEYVNEGLNDAVLPLVDVVCTGGALRLVDEPVGDGRATLALALTSPDGPGGILRPGARGAISLVLEDDLTATEAIITVTEADYGVGMDWAGVRADYPCPPYLPVAAWALAWDFFLADVGSTAGDLQRVLAANATYLSRFDIRSHRRDTLVDFVFRQAGGFWTLFRRFSDSAFGHGQPEPHGFKAYTDPDGHVTIGSAWGVRMFERLDDGSYLPLRGDHGILTDTGSGYELRETDGSRWVFRMDGRPDFQEQPNGRRLTFAYAGDRTSGVFDSLGRSLTFGYGALDRIETVIDERGRVTRLAYSPDGEHLVTVSNRTGVVQLAYAAGGPPAWAHTIAAVTHSDLSHSYLAYDDRGRLEQTWRDGGIEVVDYGYDRGGVSRTDALGRRAWYYRNHNGRLDAELSATRDPSGRWTRYRYDTEYNLVRVEMPEGGIHDLDYDDLGNLVSWIDPLMNRIHLEYEPDWNQVTRVLQPGHQPTRQTYDGLARLTRVTVADHSYRTVDYDTDSRISEYTNRRGQTTRLVRNPDGTVAEKQFADGKRWSYGHDALGRIVSVSNEVQVLAWNWNDRDRLARIEDDTGRWMEFEYRGNGSPARVRYDDGFEIQYRYDTAGRLEQVLDHALHPVLTYAYDAAGQVAHIDRGTAGYSVFDYDTNGRVALIDHRRADGSEISRSRYRYDGVGRPVEAATESGTWTYRYDAAGRLVRAALEGASAPLVNTVVEYTYDAGGNRTSITVDGMPTTSTLNALDQVTHVGDAVLHYDDDGNWIGRSGVPGTWTGIYDAENRLSSQTSALGSWTFAYDALGRRIGVTRDGQSRRFLLDPHGEGRVSAEYDAAGALATHYVHGWGLEAGRDAAGIWFYYLHDLTGNTTEVLDVSGTTLNRYRYRPFGPLLLREETVPNAFRYVGRWGVMDDDSGLLHMRRRYYDPALGRFVGEESRGALIPNRYQYARNQPIHRIDPTGLESLVQWIGDGLYDAWTTDYFDQDYIYDNNNPHELIEKNRDNVHPDYDDLSPDNIEDAQDNVRDLLKKTEDTIQESIEIVYPNVDPKDLIDHPGKELLDLISKPKKVYDLLHDLIDPDVPPKDRPDDETEIDIGRSADPNEIVGPGGVGDGRWLRNDQLLTYTIYFENLTNATLAAQAVHVAGDLDPDLDWETFQWSGYAVGTRQVNILGSPQAYAGQMDLRDSCGLLVDVSGNLDPDTGRITWDLVAIDPETGLPTQEPLAGFLPPNTDPPQGEGWVRYTIRIRDEAISGANLHAEATIVFDVNEPLDTNVHTNHADRTPPTSAVVALPPRSDRPLLLAIGAADGHAGVADVDLFVSRLDAPYQKWGPYEADSTVVLHADPGAAYRFYSVARDKVGNTEAVPTTPDASTRVKHYITRVSEQDGGMIVLTWESAAGLTYAVGVQSNLVAGVPDVITGGILPVPPLNTHTVQLHGAEAQFLRVDVEE